MFVLELQVLPVLRRSPEGSGVPMDFADATLLDEVQDYWWIEKACIVVPCQIFGNPCPM